jgi:hypothetical protein
VEGTARGRRAGPGDARLMAGPVRWKEGEGYDVHVLRGGPPSKPLDGALERDPAGSLTFVPRFKGAPNNFGVSIDGATGVVTASILQGAPSFNFLLTARQTVAGTPSETIIRIHVHDSVKKIWLTPAALPVYLGSPECRFTVLAMFDRDPDGVVGDITDWPVLTYSSFNPFEVDVNNRGDIFRGEEEPVGGRLIVRPGSATPPEHVQITVELKLSSPPTDLEHTAKAIPRPQWEEIGRDVKKTRVEFVAGEIAPRPNQADRTKKDSIESVIDNHANILFVSEGFLDGQEKAFRQVVQTIVDQELRAKEALEPFKLLKDSINYWSVFVPSPEEGITLLGEYEISGSPGKQVASELPRPEPPTTPRWSIEHMIHEAGLPLPADPPLSTSADWVANRSKLFGVPAGVTVDAAALAAWNDLRKRAVLNERGSAFGMCHADRPQASSQRAREEQLLLDRRRTSPESVQKFVKSLRFVNRAPMGQVWEHGTGKNFGLVCFVCQSSKLGGAFQNAPLLGPGGVVTGSSAYFTAGTAIVAGAGVRPAAAGMDLVPRPVGKSFPSAVYASLVAHECGHALGLGDEYGGDAKYDANVHGIPTDPNLQVETALAPIDPSTNRRDFDAGQIRWTWPRVKKARLLDGFPTLQGDPAQFSVPLVPGGGPGFAKDDLARIREWPVRRHPAADPFASIALRVDSAAASTATVSYVNPGGPRLDPSVFNPAKKYVLICTSVKPGVELPLVSGTISQQIDSSNGPLNAPKGSRNAACVAGGGSKITTTATNLPDGFRPPSGLASKADIIGVYEGGAYVECGVFRPAGRCRMRSGLDAALPFCHVCRYVIVDAIDPKLHGRLDAIYDRQYP